MLIHKLFFSNLLRILQDELHNRFSHFFMIGYKFEQYLEEICEGLALLDCIYFSFTTVFLIKQAKMPNNKK
jgi:hypothetical protein